MAPAAYRSAQAPRWHKGMMMCLVKIWVAPRAGKWQLQFADWLRSTRKSCPHRKASLFFSSFCYCHRTRFVFFHFLVPHQCSYKVCVPRTQLFSALCLPRCPLCLSVSEQCGICFADREGKAEQGVLDHTTHYLLWWILCILLHCPHVNGLDVQKNGWMCEINCCSWFCYIAKSTSCSVPLFTAHSIKAVRSHKLGRQKAQNERVSTVVQTL